MWSLLATTPSVTLNCVDVGGATMGTQTTYFAYGYSGQNRPLVEGINTTEGTAAANSAEMPNSGVLTQFVSKSGGNTPSVNLYYDMEDERFQSRNFAADQVIPTTGAVIRPDGNRLRQLQEHQHRQGRTAQCPSGRFSVRPVPSCGAWVAASRPAAWH